MNIYKKYHSIWWGLVEFNDLKFVFLHLDRKSNLNKVNQMAGQQIGQQNKQWVGDPH